MHYTVYSFFLNVDGDDRFHCQNHTRASTSHPVRYIKYNYNKRAIFTLLARTAHDQLHVRGLS